MVQTAEIDVCSLDGLFLEKVVGHKGYLWNVAYTILDRMKQVLDNTFHFGVLFSDLYTGVFMRTAYINKSTIF